MFKFTNCQARLKSSCLLGLVSLASFSANAIIDSSLQMQLGNPSNATTDPSNTNHYLIVRSVEAMDYSDYLREPNWASWDLTSADVGDSGRSDAFAADTNLPPLFYEVKSNDYSGSGYDRGHMCPSADRTDNLADNIEVFLMDNMIPQASDNNSGTWANFEGYCRALLSSNEVLIVCGPGGFTGQRTSSSGQIMIPTFTWKVAVAVPLGAGTATNRITTATRVIAIEVPNTNGVSPAWQNYVTTARQVERDTAFTFFTALPPLVASALRSKLDGTNYPPPSIVSFSPSAAEPNTAIIITGTNFNSATQVSFHGIPAVFSLDSNTQIMATVPADASSGTISVTTPSGTAASLNSFTVIQPTSVDLAIACSHFGNFTQGDTNDAYTLVVTNVSGLASSGSVTVSNFLPAGFTATSLGGTGWTADLPSLTCTRSDSLAPGSAYPPLTLTVAVAPSAPAVVTNIVSLSGGGDTNLANNTAFDPTAINQTSPVVLLAGWDASAQTNYGISPFLPTTNASHLAISGLIRGTGVSTNGTPALHAWGGTGWTNTTAAAAIASNQFLTCTIGASNGFAVSFTAISRFDYRRSGTGPSNGLLQYQIGSGAFNDITTLAYPSSSSSGSSLGSIDLSSVAALQNVGAGTNVTFRIVNYGGGSAGNWYINDTSNSLAPDFEIAGIVIPVFPDLVISASHSGVFTQADVGDMCTITVSNAGPAASSGLISVTNLLPPGLTATAVGGAGWIADLSTLSFSRADALVPGASYPPIQITFDVATNASATLTNRVQVYGGGQTNTGNDLAFDVFTIVPLTPSELWRLQYFGNKANSGAGADTVITSADGMPNLYKYALGLNPLVATNDPAVGDISIGYLTIRSSKNPNATDVSITAEAAAEISGGGWSSTNVIIDQNSAIFFQAHESTPVFSAAQKFMRLQVSRP